MEMKGMLLLAYAAVNLIVFLMYAADKYKARHNQWRIPERTLITAAVLGIIGAILGMVVMHHKTRKPKFLFAIPAIAVLEGAAVVVYFLKFTAGVL